MTRSIQLSRHQQFTYVKHVLQNIIQQLGIYVFPTLSYGMHHYGQLHMESPVLYDVNFPTNPKLDYFCCDLVDARLATNKILPTTFLGCQTIYQSSHYYPDEDDRIKYIWTIKDSPSRPSTHYAIDLWDEGQYDLRESLALMMGFLEFDPLQPRGTRIVTHHTVYFNTRNNTRGTLEVAQLGKDHIGIRNEDYPLGGVRISCNIHIKQLYYMFGKRVLFEVGEWVKDHLGILPYTLYEFPVSVFTLEPDQWLMQVPQDGFVHFNHGLEEVTGTHLLKDAKF